MTITLHHLEYSQSFRLIWLMEVLGADYELVSYPRDRATQLAPKDYKALSPLGTAPFITDGDMVLAESNAAIDHIVDQYPESGLRIEAGAPGRARYLFWFHTAQGSMMPVLFMNTVFGLMPAQAPSFVRPMLKGALAAVSNMLVKPRLEKLLDEAEKHLAEHKWLAGEQLTAADITMCYPMASAKKAGYIKPRYKNCHRWLQQMEADAAFQRAKERDGGRSMVFTVK